MPFYSIKMLPEWAQTLGVVFSVMLIAPSWGGMINGLLTMRGAWDKVRDSAVLKFFVVAITAYGMATFYKPKNFPSISASIEYKDMDSGKTIKNWIFALQQKLQNKKIGIAVGTHNSEEKIGYEGWSEINISDKLKIIPVFFVRETNQLNPELGFSINTKFSY